MTSALPLRTFVLEWILGIGQSDKSWTLSNLAFKIAVVDRDVSDEDHPDAIFPGQGS